MGSVSPINELSEGASISRRKPHRKSRKGCAECRRRKVKCSEDKPRCLACVRYDVSCLYPHRTLTSANTASSLGHITGPIASVSTPPVGGSCDLSNSPSCHGLNSEVGNGLDRIAPAWFGIDDLALLHHWTLATSRTIFASPHVDHCWQSTFPQIGFRHPFVMHGILGLAALHLSYIDPSSRERRALDAGRYHNVALDGFREGINHVMNGNYNNSDALFACSVLNIIYVFGMLGRLRDNQKDGSTSRTARVLGGEWIPMIRGVGAVVRPAYERVRRGPLGPMLGLDHWDELDPDRDPATGDERFRGVQEAWAAHRGDAEVYDSAWHMLRRCALFSMQFTTASNEGSAKWGYNRQWAGPMAFLHEAPQEYFVRLHQRQPPALVIFAYFGALLHELNDYWFLEGWGRDIIEVVDEVLGDYWRPWLRWPREVIRLDQHG